MCFEYCADRCIVVATALFETGEIVSAEEYLRGSIHGIEIHCWVSEKVRVTLTERVFCAMKIVCVLSSDSIEPGVEIRGGGGNPYNAYGLWQDGVELIT